MLINVEWNGWNDQWVNPEFVERIWIEARRVGVAFVRMRVSGETLFYPCDDLETAKRLMHDLATTMNCECEARDREGSKQR